MLLSEAVVVLPLYRHTCRCGPAEVSGHGAAETVEGASMPGCDTIPDVRRCLSPAGAAPPASPPPTSSSLPLVRSMSVRVVTGKGEFEFPAWKPHDAKPTSRRQCLSIRCARRHELTLYAALICSGGRRQMHRGT